MTKLKRTLLTISALTLGMTLSACAQEASVTETVKDTVTSAQTAPQSTPDPQAAPVSAPADTPAGQNQHQGHDHQMPDPNSVDIDHAFDFAPDDHLVGASDAPVTMIVYASVTCGHCGGWFTSEWPQIKSKYIDSGKVQMAFREIPTPPEGVSIPGFIIANCAPEDKYMDLIVHQMQNQKATFKSIEEGKGQAVLKSWTDMAGLKNEAEVEACFKNKAHLERLDRAGKRMTKAGMRGVPAIIIDGQVFAAEDKSAAALSAIIDPLLK